MLSKANLTRALIAVALLAVVGVAADYWTSHPANAERRYVGRQSCIECHQDQAKAWTGSNHDKAMDLATPEFVLGNFDNQEFEHFGVTSKFTSEGDKFFVTTENAKGEMEKFFIKYTFGVAPLQQYMVEFADGRVQVLSIAWDTENKRWYHLYPDEKIPAGDWLHWTGAGQNWNYMCAECHSTDVHKNYDLATNTYHTTFSEIDVSCEACHGPGSLHIELAHSKSLFWDRLNGYGLAKLKSPDTHVEIETCAKCHSRRRLVYPGHRAGDKFLDFYAPDMPDGDVYQRDGQLNQEAYEYGSFVQSKMYHKGVRCTDCHNPHTATLRAEGNNLCVRCHTAGKFDTPAHHHHKPDGKGASCVACHMPQTTYMVVDPRRDHSLRVPRPDLTIKFGTKNACTPCHDDKSAEWARDAIASWTGGKQPGADHFGKLLATARSGGDKSESADIALSGNAKFPSIVRASGMSLLAEHADPSAMRAAEQGLSDHDPLVRAVAIRTFEQLTPRPLDAPAEQRLVLHLTPLLHDPIRMVRCEAARVLTLVPTGRLLPEQQAAYDLALDEYIAGQNENSDQPATHLNLGVMYGNQRKFDKAEEAYKTAIRLEKSFVPARVNLAMLYHEQGKSADAERLFREVIDLQPKMADAHYSLGLLLAENKQRLADAADSLAKAAELAPKNARYHYNLGLAYLQLDRTATAEKELLAAYQLAPAQSNEFYEFVQALAYFYTQQNQLERAEKFRRLLPGR